MGVWYEIRENIFRTSTPLTYVILLLPILSVSAKVGTLEFLYIYSIIMSFLYIALARTVSILRTGLERRKDNSPPTEDYSTYWEGFWTLSWEAWFGHKTDAKPIRNHATRPIFPYLVYSFWGLVISAAAFLVTGVILSWLVISGTLDEAADIPVLIEVVQNAPFGLVELLHTIVPILDGLTFSNRIVIGGVAFSTGFFFLTGARNLTTASEELHRRFLIFLVENNPLFANEGLNMLILAVPYGLLLYAI